MNFQKREIKKTFTAKPIKVKINYKSKRSSISKKIWKFVLWLFLSFIFIWILSLIFIYNKYLSDLPSVKELENLNIAQATTIYDRDWNELYKIFKEKRTYVSYDKINKNMINALVSWEDKRYWENPWIDVIGLIRAFIYWIIWKNEGFWWTSTLTQQLIRNTIIENRSSNETFSEKMWRKIKEIYLAFKLTQSLSKSKILELYLNKISFWWNAFWIEQASETFFWKEAIDLDILESSILASLPKWPSYYSPYNHSDRLLWYVYIYWDWSSTNTGTWNEVVSTETELSSTEDTSIDVLPTESDSKKIITSKDLLENNESVEKFKSYLLSLKAKRMADWKLLLCWVKKDYLKSSLNIDEQWCFVSEYSNLLSFLNDIKINLWDDKFLEYEVWRKDFILWRLLEDDKINFDEYINSINRWIWFDFKEFRENIDMPHFVFYIKELLEVKYKYSKELIEAWWLKIYTTIDSDLQKKAEELVLKYSDINKTKFDAQNAALISIDNKNWDILAMVWWRDYFDKENNWNVNMITSKLQPWSSFKPFVYSLAIFKEKIWSKTPVYDLKTNFPWYTPSNFDWKFMWKMNISTALDNSRNIPAVKMFTLAWWELEIVNFMKKLWVESFNAKWQYWAPMALGTAELTPLELASAYSVFANLWKKVDINPILKIEDSKGLIIEEKKNIEKEQVISDWQSYIISKILSDTESRPAWWNSFLTLKSRPVAAKTWTSTKQYVKAWKKVIYPSNLWTVWYTPQITTVVWAWNTDWKELNLKWNWLEWAWPIWRDFMEYAHTWKEVEQWKQPSSVKSVNISNITWLLPSPEDSNKDFIVNSLFLNKPTEYDNSLKTIKVDALCNWKITDKTPESAIKEITVLEFHSLRPENASWEKPVQDWVKSWSYKEIYWNIPDIVTQVSDEECKRDWVDSDINVWINIENWSDILSWKNYIEVWYKSENPIIKIEFFIWEDKVDSVVIDNKKSWVYTWEFNLPKNLSWNNILKIRVIDSQYFSEDIDVNVNIIEKDFYSPEIKITNPVDLSIKLYDDEYFNLRWEIIDSSTIRTINIYIDDKLEEVWIKDRRFVYKIEWKNLAIGSHVIKVEAIDNSFNTWFEEIKVEVIKK